MGEVWRRDSRFSFSSFFVCVKRDIVSCFLVSYPNTVSPSFSILFLNLLHWGAAPASLDVAAPASRPGCTSFHRHNAVTHASNSLWAHLCLYSSRLFSSVRARFASVLFLCQLSTCCYNYTTPVVRVFCVSHVEARHQPARLYPSVSCPLLFIQPLAVLTLLRHLVRALAPATKFDPLANLFLICVPAVLFPICTANTPSPRPAHHRLAREKVDLVSTL